MEAPLTRLIMQITRLPLELVQMILGYVPVRRRLKVKAPLFTSTQWGHYNRRVEGIPRNVGGVNYVDPMWRNWQHYTGMQGDSDTPGDWGETWTPVEIPATLKGFALGYVT